MVEPNEPSQFSDHGELQFSMPFFALDSSPLSTKLGCCSEYIRNNTTNEWEVQMISSSLNNPLAKWGIVPKPAQIAILRVDY